MRCNALSDVTKRYLSRYYEILDAMEAEMTAPAQEANISHEFIVRMIPHHEAAIKMSENLLQYTTLVPLQKIAQGIITGQTRGVAAMRAAAGVCALPASPDVELRLYDCRFRRITKTMLRQMHDAEATNEINADFIREMIPHHVGAVRMSQNALAYTVCPELEPILKNIISSQTRGILELRRLLRCIC